MMPLSVPEQLCLELVDRDVWPERLPPGAACHDWLLPPVSWPALHAMNKQGATEKAALNQQRAMNKEGALVPEQSSLLVQEQSS